MGSLGNLEWQPLNYNMFLTFALSTVIHFICFIDRRDSFKKINFYFRYGGYACRLLTWVYCTQVLSKEPSRQFFSPHPASLPSFQ